MRRVGLIVAAVFVFTSALSVGLGADQQQAPQGQGGAAPASQGGGGQGSGPQNTIGGVGVPADTPQQGGQGQGGRGGGGGRGRAAGPPPKPAPRDANGRASCGAPRRRRRACGCRPSASPIRSPPTRRFRSSRGRRRCTTIRQTQRARAAHAVQAVGLLAPVPDAVRRGVRGASRAQRRYIFDIGGPHTFRTVYMDGRTHPADLKPSYYGHSIGRWEGDTLVIDTVGFNERSGSTAAACRTRPDAHHRAVHAHRPGHDRVRDHGRRSRRLHGAVERRASTCDGKPAPSCSSTSASRRTTRPN